MPPRRSAIGDPDLSLGRRCQNRPENRLRLRLDSALVIGRQRPELALELLGIEPLLAVTREDRLNRGVAAFSCLKCDQWKIYFARRRSVAAFFSIASRSRRRCSSGVPGSPDFILGSGVVAGGLAGGFIAAALFRLADPPASQAPLAKPEAPTRIELV